LIGVKDETAPETHVVDHDSRGKTTMTYRTNEVNRLPQLMATAANLGRALDAHVSGLYVVPAVQVYPSVGFEAAPQVFEGNRTYFKDHAAAVRASFEEAMRREGLNFDIHVVDAKTPLIADDVVAYGRTTDIILVSATDPEEVTGVERDFVEQVIVGAGRPVIILPAKADATLSLEQIVIGWDGGREAARAVFDSLPLLRAAKMVRIVVADPQKEPGLRGAVPGADLAETLARQGVRAETQGLPTEGLDAGQALLRCADDFGAGLIVMGAYGHSRLTEFIFGGATRFVLSQQNRPVLMSH
jgi:nucleotide-binding universal stress UspA family protein